MKNIQFLFLKYPEAYSITQLFSLNLEDIIW